MSLQQEILDEARKFGICDKFRNELETRTLSINQLCMMYHRGLDFCIEHNFPKREIIDKFSEADLHRNGIYYDYNGNIENYGNAFLVINGDSDVDVHITLATSLYIRHNTKVRLYIDDGAFVYVTLHDCSQVEIVKKGKGSRAYASLYKGIVVNKEMFNEINYK